MQLLDTGDVARPGRILVPGPVVDADDLVATLGRVEAELVELVVEPSQESPALTGNAVAIVTVSGYPEAVKRVEGDRIVESVDRSRLLLAGPPMTVATSAVRKALAGRSGRCHLVEALFESGGTVVPAGSPPA